MSAPVDILRADIAGRIKLRRWRRKLQVLLHANAMQAHLQRLRARGVSGRRQSPRRDALILMYHRVADLSSDPQSLCVTPRHFAEQLAVLQERFAIIPLRELARRPRMGQSITGTAAITFDDGYADNLHEAKPLLERNGAPATVFVTSSYMGGNREFWWDELERVLLRAGELPRWLRFEAAGQTYACDLRADAVYTEAASARDRHWHSHDRAVPTRRHALYRVLHRLLYMMTSAQREQVLEQLRRWGRLDHAGRCTHLPLTEAETLSLSKGGLMEIGAHTATHPVLSMIGIDEQKAEIEISKRRLEHVTGGPITSFAYPFGSLSDYQAQTIRAVAEMGFECACSTFADVVTDAADRFQLPRFTIRDWSGAQLRERLDAWTRVS